MGKISIIIPTRNRFNDLIRCLDGVGKNDVSLLKEIIIIDDCSNQTLNYAELQCNLPIKIIRNNKKQGASKCRNIGSKYISGSIIAFLDDDAIPPPNWLEIIKKEMTKERGAITGKVIGFDKNIVSKARQARYDKRYKYLQYGERVMFFSGGNSAVWANLFLSQGGFNKYGSGSDNSLVDNLNNQGYYVHFIPKLYILHRNSKGFKTAMKEAYSSGFSHPNRLNIIQAIGLMANYKSNAIGSNVLIGFVNWFLNAIHLYGRTKKLEVK